MVIPKDQVNVLIKNGQAAGLTGQEVLDGLVERGYQPEGVDIAAAKQQLEQKKSAEAQQTFGGRAKEDIVTERQKIADINSSDAPLTTKIAENAAVVTGLPFKIAFDALPKPAREGLKFVGDAIASGFKVGVDKLADTKLFTEIGNLEAQGYINPQTAPEFYKLKNALATTSAVGETIGNVAGLEAGASTAVKLVDKAVSTVNSAIDTAGNAFDALKNDTTKAYNKFSDKVASGKIDTQTQTILKETPVQKLDEYIQQGQEALTDPRVNTPLQNAGLQAEEVAKTIKADLGTIGADKSALLDTVGKTRVPDVALKQISKVEPFLQKKLTAAERNLVNSYLEELKALGKNPTAQSVDATIDKLQATLFEQKGGVAVPTTTRVQSFINKSIGELNTELKSTVDKALGSDAYSTLNAQYANKINVFNQLNKALGEGGAKGGSIMKRFFSPQDAGIKKLFQTIRGQYGIDLGQEATLAKFVMETLGDTRANSFLELPPTTATGVLGKAVDFAEKQLTKPEKVFNSARKMTK